MAKKIIRLKVKNIKVQEQDKKQSYTKDNVRYTYNPKVSEKEVEKENEGIDEKEPQKVNKENKTLIPVMAIFSILILAIILIQNYQMNSFYKQYNKLLEQNQQIITQTNQAIQNINGKLNSTDSQNSNITPIPINPEATEPANIQETPDGEFDNRAFLGISVDEETNGKNPIGVKIQNVIDLSAAKNCGLQANDIIVSIDGEATPDMETLSGIISKHIADEEVKIEYARIIDGDLKFQSTTAKLSARGNFALDD